MTDIWTITFSGLVEDRNVTLSRYSSNEIKLTTTQKNMETSEASSDGSTHIFPLNYSVGDPIEVHANNPEELVNELLEIGFSISAANEIAEKLRKNAT